ncbi:MAG TPA: DHHA1 domain-containing protein, partial [Methylococcaceae bacterium]|nr:DHHA1 domain-containing protein [Methylococcaceae bacterium]
RVEAVTGAAAIQWVEETDQLLRSLCASARTSRDSLEERLLQMLDKARAAEKELERLKARLASAAGSDLSAQAVDINGVKVLATQLSDGDPKALRDLVDQLKNKLGSGAVVLALAKDDKVSLAAGVTKDLTARLSAVDLVNAVATPLGGKGGGRPDFAQAGAGNSAGLPAALDGVAEWVRQKVAL